MGAAYLPPTIMHLASVAKKKVGCNISLINPTDTNKEDSIWTSAAMSYNYISAAHTDDDCFFSALMITVENEYDTVVKDNGTVIKKDCLYEMSQEIAVYFCFPTCGKAIGLRPGDILLFNPLSRQLFCRMQTLFVVINSNIYANNMLQLVHIQIEQVMVLP